MTRFVVDLLQYLRDILIVQAGGENTHHSDVFERNLDLPQDILFEMISLATKSLADIKASLQPKIYAEMMTIRLAEIDSQPELSGEVAEELSSLREEVARLKQALANVGSTPKQSVSTPSRPTNNKSIYRVDRNKVQSILQEAVENPDLARQNLIRLQNAWEKSSKAYQDQIRHSWLVLNQLLLMNTMRFWLLNRISMLVKP